MKDVVSKTAGLIAYGTHLRCAKLLAGFQLDDVSRLLGHSSVKVTEMYYAKWVASRKRRLKRLVADSLVNA